MARPTRIVNQAPPPPSSRPEAEVSEIRAASRPRNAGRLRHARPGAIYAGLGLWAIVTLLPLAWVLTTSFKPNDQAMSFPPSVIPQEVTLENYRFILTDPGLVHSLFNSLLVTVPATALAVLVSALAAYAFARYAFPGKTWLRGGILAVFMMPAVMNLVPLYMLYQQVGLLNSKLGLILVYQVLILPLDIFMLEGYFRTIPAEVEEAAHLDGASLWDVLRHVTFPLSWPGFAVAAIISFRFAWNEFVFPLTLTSTPDQNVFQVAIYRFLGLYRIEWGYLTAGIAVGMVPVILLLVLFQRQMISGLTMGIGKQ